jgi:oligopeptide transport system permease protein
MPPEVSLSDAALAEHGGAETAASLWGDAWHRLAKNKMAIGGLWFTIALTLLCFLGPLAAKLPAGIRPAGLSHSHETINLDQRVVPPGATHWLGTDQLGRDVLARILIGGRISLLVALSATVVSLVIGLLYGAVSGYVGGKLDAVMMRVVDILYALPLAVFVVLLMVFVGRSIFLLFVAIGAVEWLTMARIVRAQVMSLKKQEFIEAAVSLGLRRTRIIIRHIIPNVLGVVIVYATLTVPGVMLLEAFLSFLGLGVQPPMSSWGSLIKEGADWMEESPWILISTGAFFSLTLFSLNFLGDGLRDALDVRASKD